jgi:hypothetical protein
MLKPDRDFQIPEETIKVAKAAFPKGNIYLTLRDAFGTIFEDEIFKRVIPITWPTCRKSRMSGHDYRDAIS